MHDFPDIFSSYPSIGSAFLASGTSFTLLTVLGYCAPLSSAAKEWVKRENPYSSIDRQFTIIRRFLFGESPFSVRRNTSFIVVFILCFLYLYLIPFYGMKFVNEEGYYFFVWSIGYSFLYFQYLETYPIQSAIFVTYAFLLCHLHFYILDKITYSWWPYRRKPMTYILSLFISFLSVLLILFFLSVGTIITIHAGEENDLIYSYFKSLMALKTSIWAMFERESPGDELGSLDFALVICTDILFLTAIIAITLINILYAGVLSFLFFDRVFRKQFGFSTDRIDEDPINYIARLFSIMVFLAVFSLNVFEMMLKSLV